MRWEEAIGANQRVSAMREEGRTVLASSMSGKKMLGGRPRFSLHVSYLAVYFRRKRCKSIVNATRYVQMICYVLL